MNKGTRRVRNWGLWVLVVFLASTASGGIFTYEPITDPIESASFSVDFAAFVGHRTVLGYEMNYVKLIDPTGASDPLDLSDEFFGTATWPDEPKMNMGLLETGIVSAEIDQSFFSALASGKIGVAFRFTDTDDAMFAMDFMGLTIETASATITSYYGWPVGNENDGFGIGLADGADLPEPLPVSIPVGVTRMGFNETQATKTEVPEPASLALLGLGVAWLLGRRSGRGRMRGTVVVVLLATVLLVQGASAITITDVKIYQMDFGELTGTPITDSNCGDFEFTVIPDDDPNIYFLNLTVRKDASSPSFWVIQNMMAPVGRDLSEPFTGVSSFSLADLVEEGTALQNIEYQMDLSTGPLTSAPVPGSFTAVSVLDGMRNVGAGIENISEGEVGGPGDSPNIRFTGGSDSNIVRTRDDVPNIEEEPNGCAAASVTRSLLWMHKRCFINLRNQTDPNTLKKVFDTAAHRDPNKPVWGIANFLNGKLRVTKDVNVINKFAGPNDFNNFSSPDGNMHYRGKISWEFIRNEIDANEDVELIYKDRLSTFGEGIGHAVTVIGYTHSRDSNGLWIQDDANQGQPDPCNQRRWAQYNRYGQLIFDGWRRVDVDFIVSESPEPKVEQVHGYPPDGEHSPDVAVGASAGITAAVQYNFAGVPGADVEFIKRYGGFRFTSGFIVNDGQKTVATTNGDGLATIDIVGETPGPAIIEVTITGAEEFATYLLFDVIPCPITQNRDEDCDVDFKDYAIFANDWLNGEDQSQLRLLCEQWLEGK
jgi:hypothetical protein